MSDGNLVDNIVAFLMAGYDTTAFALTWTLYLISQSPEWEARMLRRDRAGRRGRAGHRRACRQLTVVKQVLNESLRLFPTAPVIVRDIVEDTRVRRVTAFPPARSASSRSMPFIGTAPTGTSPTGSIPVASRQNGAKPSRFQFMPFGAGPRICIGAAFAMIEATIMLATFVRAAHFEIVGGIDPKPVGRMFLVPDGGLPMRVSMRPTTMNAAVSPLGDPAFARTDSLGLYSAPALCCTIMKVS